ncbi:hypothetical protein FB451DRAFT_665601 [Mycena latifolia]|nr:hypothetical protein FB451DRAFT_665601 [Mycena latifolia]
MLAFKVLCIAATAPLLVPAAYVVDTGMTARDLVPVLYVKTELERFEHNTNATIEKRTDITDCIKYVEEGTACFDISSNIRTIGSTIATVAFGSSSVKDCSVHTGSIDGVQWRYYGTGPGSECDTSAELKTIRGALDAFLQDSVDGECKEVCLQMTHGGTWTGFLSVSPVGSAAPSDCGNSGYGEHGGSPASTVQG